jgi:hypothetical protein
MSSFHIFCFICKKAYPILEIVCRIYAEEIIAVIIIVFYIRITL